MIKNIIFDFDGVILNSVPVKTQAFRKLFNQYNVELVDKLIDYHLLNGGVSRYKKIEYFYRELLKQEVDKTEIQRLAQNYSDLTLSELCKKKYLIEETIQFIKTNNCKYSFHVASGADEGDLKQICKSLNIEKYFLSIYGSPVVKTELVAKILSENNYTKSETILIGDSVNDYDAAKKNNIEFYGYNNNELKNIKGSHYISWMDKFEENL